jgi:hypothetical protein
MAKPKRPKPPVQPTVRRLPPGPVRTDLQYSCEPSRSRDRTRMIAFQNPALYNAFLETGQIRDQLENDDQLPDSSDRATPESGNTIPTWNAPLPKKFRKNFGKDHTPGEPTAIHPDLLGEEEDMEYMWWKWSDDHGDILDEIEEEQYRPAEEQAVEGVPNPRQMGT